MLEKRESEFKALQQDHRKLQEQYERLLAAKQDTTTLSATTTLTSSDLFQPTYSDPRLAAQNTLSDTAYNVRAEKC